MHSINLSIVTTNVVTNQSEIQTLPYCHSYFDLIPAPQSGIIIFSSGDFLYFK